MTRQGSTSLRTTSAGLIAALAVCLFAANPAHAQAGSESAAQAAPLPAAPAPRALAPAPSWSALTPAQKVLLAPLEPDWAGLDADHRNKWLSVAAKLSNLPLDEQARMQERMRDWARLSPAERRQARIGWQMAKQVGADQRQAKWEAYQALPAERRQELADKAAKKQAAAAQPQSVRPPAGTQVKSNIVPTAVNAGPPTAVAATLLQAKPGASTVLMTRLPTMPAHQSAGQPKVIADPNMVDPHTLLPRSLKAPAAASAAG